MAGIVITGTDIDGIVLSNPATDDPATITATGYVTNQTATHDYDAIYGAPGYSWTVANLGTIEERHGGLYAEGIHLTRVAAEWRQISAPSAPKVASVFTCGLTAPSPTARAARQKV